MAETASFAALLRTWRQRAMLTQEQLAWRAGLGVRTIRRLESSGTGQPRTESIRLIADALQLSEADRAWLAGSGGAERQPSEPPRTQTPRQLPADLAAFVGRAEHLARLDGVLARQAGTPAVVVISAISGTAGVGKTCLAVQWGHRIADRFPDGQLYINLRGFDPGGTPVEPSTAIRTFLDALDVAPQRIPADLDAQAALLRTQLAGKRMLLLLDNARDVDQIRPLLPGTAGCLVVVTSRHRLTALSALQGASTLTLGLLSASEARDLLAARLGAERVAQEPAAVEEIITRCGNLPLALAIAAARVASQPQLTLTAVASQMRAAVLDALDTSDPYVDIRSVFSWSYAGVSAAGARLFRLLGLHPGPDISLAAAASLAACGVTQTKRLLAELARAHLITEHQPDRYVFHDLLRLFAAEQVRSTESQAQRRAATHRLLDHYLHTAYTADRLINPHRAPIELPKAKPGAATDRLPDEKQALEWLAGERRVLVALIDYADKIGWDRHAYQLDWTIAQYLYRCGQWIEQTATGRAAVAAAHRGSDPAAQARAHHNLARAHLQLGHHDLAHEHLSEAIRLADGTDDLCGQGDAHHVMSWVLERKGCHTEAFAHAVQALDRFNAAANRFGRARVLNTIGWFHAQLGNHETAITFCQEALAQLEELGNKEGMAVTWHSIGYAQHNLGRHQAALRCYHQALTLFAELQDRYYEAATLDSLGDTHRAIGNLDAARAAWQRALSTLEAMNHPTAEGVRAKLHSCRPHRGQRIRRTSTPSDLTIQAAASHAVRSNRRTA